MNPQNPLPTLDDPKLLTALRQAFETTWVVLRAHEPLLDADKAQQLSSELSRTLVKYAVEGVTDPAQLRKLALESIPLASTRTQPA